MRQKLTCVSSRGKINNARWSCILYIIQKQKSPQKMAQVVGTKLEITKTIQKYLLIDVKLRWLIPAFQNHLQFPIEGTS